MVKLTFYDKLNIEISSDDDYELDLIRSLLTTREKIRKFNYKTKKTLWVTEEVNQYRIKRNKVYVGAGYLPILEEFLIEEEIEYEVIGKPEVDKIKIKDNWIERFKNHPKGEEYSKAQLEFARVVEENSKGVLSLPVGCFSGDTKVRLLDGTTPTMKELAETGREDFWVLSTDDEGKIIPSKATSCWKTKTTSDLVIVTLDDDTKYTCTPEHLWRMRDGSWKRADELVENNPLMPLHHNHKVKSVERYTGEPIDVYDIEVPGLENFAIEDGNGSGVFVHNSGKGDMIVALVDSFLSDETKSGNVVLISYSAKVCEELKERLKQFSIESKRVKVIQPTGYCRRTAYKTDEELFDWDSNVSLFIADECHHFTASSWKEYTERCQPDYIYGFSGSADKDGGWEINLDNIKQRKLETAAFDVMSYCGPAITHKELPTPIRIYRTTRWIADKETYKAFINNPANPKQLAPKFTLMNPEFPKILKEVIEKCTSNDSICYIPELTSIESGVFLCKSLNELGIPTLFLSGQTIESPVGEVEMTLEDIKEMARGKYIKVLISNGVGVEGIDIPGLSSIVSLTGKSYKNVVQAIGRSARANIVDCIFIFDKNNGVYNSQAYSRYKTVTQRLNIVSNVVI